MSVPPFLIRLLVPARYRERFDSLVGWAAVIVVGSLGAGALVGTLVARWLTWPTAAVVALLIVVWGPDLVAKLPRARRR